jgi:hypothetical protein
MPDNASLSVRRRNAEGVSPFSVPNATRTLAQGLTYANSDEMEAYLRTLFSRDPNAYRREVERIRGELDRYSSANPKTAFGLETAGMIGGAMLVPELAALRAPGILARAPAATKFVLGGLDDAAQGALYAAGQAKDVKDIPRSIREEAPINAAYYGGLSAGGAGVKAAARKATSTQSGYNLAKEVQRLWSKWGL